MQTACQVDRSKYCEEEGSLLFLQVNMLLFLQVYSNSAQTHEHHFKVLNAQLKQAPEGQAVQLTPGQHSFKVAADIPMQSKLLL